MDDFKVINQYEQYATHKDCLDYTLGNCSCEGDMAYMTTEYGTTILRCEKHIEDYEIRQAKIKKDYR